MVPAQVSLDDPVVLTTFSGLPRTAWVLFAGTVVNRLGYVVTPFLVFFLGARGIDTAQIPYVLTALGVGNLVGPALGGLLADRLGRRGTILGGLVGTAAAQGCLFAAPNVALLALAAALLSLAGSMVGPAAGALLADSVPVARRRAAFALSHWAVNIGTAVAGLLGGYLAAHGYWLLFAVDAASSLAFAGIAVALLPAGRFVAPTGTTSGRGYGVVLRDPLLRTLLPLFGVGLLIYSLTEVCLPLAIRDDGLSTGTYGAMAALNAVLVVLLQPVAARVFARFHQVRVYVAASVLVAVGVGGTGLVHHPWSYAVTVVVWSLGEAMASGIADSIVAGLAPADARGRYQGSFGWVWGLGRFGALSAATAVYAVAGPAVVWWFALCGGLVTAVGVLALGPAIARRTAELDRAAAAVPAPVPA
ncbi:MFS transporter [Actinocatenispora thailandica]|uniref:MFS transporter n=1 Tax=Actinocatenispora thailandica TaxID=227318 RepID=A0A7R7HYK6_9ACTN|nr:MFS transporter [Actinocatenispora thailandica]BCJ36756.1 MFS transporter [Actinocatenispora thailandica]